LLQSELERETASKLTESTHELSAVSAVSGSAIHALIYEVLDLRRERKGCERGCGSERESDVRGGDE
jgi:hypothetical protein